MVTKILKIDGIDLGAKLIKQGEVVAFPTETVYGLGGDAFNENAISKIYKAKGRPSDNPLIVHISKIEDVEKLASNIPAEFFALAKRFMPGPLTVVLPKKKCVPDLVTGGLNTVAVRMPMHIIARQLIEKSQTLIAAPSANTSTHISPTTAQHVFDDLNGKIPLIIDGGECEVGIESTVLSLTDDVPTILRPGIITADMLLEVLSAVKIFKGEVKSAESPGMKYMHYAPKCDTIIASTSDKALEIYNKKTLDNKKACILCVNENVEKYKDCKYINLGKDAHSIAKNIYGALRQAESEADFIIVDKLNGGGVYDSVMNRLIKATAGKEA